jgi:hypothetical protein
MRQPSADGLPCWRQFAILIPEPSTWAMMVLGFGMAFVGRRRLMKRAVATASFN